MNPPHILIARHSRGGPNSSASLSTPTETHAAAAGIFRSSAKARSSAIAGSSSSSPPWYHLEECESADEISALSTDPGDYEDPIELDETFTLHAKFPGTVKIVVESTTFWAHKEVLYFASSFFQAALSGEWAETSGGGRPQSVSSAITISQPRHPSGAPGSAGSSSRQTAEAQADMTFAPVDPDMDPEDLENDLDGGEGAGESDVSDWSRKKRGEKEEDDEGEDEDEDEVREAARKTSLGKLENTAGAHGESRKGKTRKSTLDDKGKLTLPSKHKLHAQGRRSGQTSATAVGKRRPQENADAVIFLEEERVP